MDASGFLNVIKPCGPTSHDVVAQVRRMLPGVKVGHLGTLDPLAAGVLPLALGRATRLTEYAHYHRKTYRAELLLGIETTSGDLDGDVASVASAGSVAPATMVWQVIRQFTGEIEQCPPASSAIRVAGKHSYEWERAGVAVAPPLRSVTVYRWRWLAVYRRDGSIEDGPFTREAASAPGSPLMPGDRLICEIECSAGTYVRALARDVGRALGLRATLSHLLRVRVGPFGITEAVSTAEIASLLAGATKPAEGVTVLTEAGLVKPPGSVWPTQLQRLVVPEEVVPRLRNGQTIGRDMVLAVTGQAGDGRAEAPEVLIETRAGQAVAIGIGCGPGRWRARRMLI